MIDRGLIAGNVLLADRADPVCPIVDLSEGDVCVDILVSVFDLSSVTLSIGDVALLVTFPNPLSCTICFAT